MVERNLWPDEEGQGADAKQPFPPPPHRVVPIGHAQPDRDEAGRPHFGDVRSGGEPGSGEAEPIDGFWRFFRHARPTLVTWNGCRLDLPVLP